MSVKSRVEYFKVLVERYQKAASKKEKGKIVDEACVNTKLHRKSVLRALGRSGNSLQKTHTGRPEKYLEGTIFVL